jgi:hypothetical protein
VKGVTDVMAQWLSFIYIICAIFHVVSFKGMSLPFSRKTAYSICNKRSLTRLYVYLK